MSKWKDKWDLKILQIFKLFSLRFYCFPTYRKPKLYLKSIWHLFWLGKRKHFLIALEKKNEIPFYVKIQWLLECEILLASLQILVINQESWYWQPVMHIMFLLLQLARFYETGSGSWWSLFKDGNRSATHSSPVCHSPRLVSVSLSLVLGLVRAGTCSSPSGLSSCSGMVSSGHPHVQPQAKRTWLTVQCQLSLLLIQGYIGWQWY